MNNFNFFKNFMILFIPLMSSSLLRSVEALEKLKLEKVTPEIFEERYDDYRKQLTEIEKNYKENQKVWEEQAKKLREEGKDREAKELEERIKEASSKYEEIYKALKKNIELTQQGWAYLSPTEKALQTESINQKIEDYNKEVGDLSVEIKRVEDEIGIITPVEPAEPKPAPPAPKPVISEEQRRYIQEELSKISNPAITEFQEVLSNVENRQDVVENAPRINSVIQAEKKVLAKLAALRPVIEAKEDYRIYQDFLQDVSNKGKAAGITFSEVQSTIKEIQDFFDNPPPAPDPNVPLESELNLTNKISSDQFKSLGSTIRDITKTVDDALRENNTQALSEAHKRLDEVRKAMEHYKLDELYNETYTSIITFRDAIAEDLKPAEEPPTPEEQKNQGYFSWALEGVSRLVEEAWKTVETVVGGVTQTAKIVSGAMQDFVKSNAIVFTEVGADTMRGAARFAEWYVDTEKTAQMLQNAAEALPTVLKVASYIPDCILTRLFDRWGKATGEQLEKSIEESFKELPVNIAYPIALLFGETAGWLVHQQIDNLGTFLKDIGADKAVSGAIGSVVSNTFNYLKNRPELATKLANAAARYYQTDPAFRDFVLSKAKWLEDRAASFERSAKAFIKDDLTTARDLVKAELDRVAPKTEEVQPPTLKQKVTSWLTGIKDTVKNFFTRSESKLETAQKNYTKTRDEYLIFIGIPDPQFATPERISQQLKEVNDKITTGQADDKFKDQLNTKTDNFLRAQSDLAGVILEHQQDLNQYFTSFETSLKAWKGILWPQEGQERPPSPTGEPFAQVVLKLFELRDIKMAYLGRMNEVLTVFKEEVANRKGSAFDPLNEKFINRMTAMVNGELISTINTATLIIEGLDQQMARLQPKF